MTCDNCGEDVYYIFSCQHCGGELSFVEALHLTKDEIKTLMEEEGKEIKGDLRTLLGGSSDDMDDLDQVDTDLGALGEEDVDDLYKGPFAPL